MMAMPKKYHLEIDGLRAIAVLSVVVFHAMPSLAPGGFFGVDIFFVISGFLITGHIYDSLNSGKFNIFDFYGRRIRRILPALIIILIATLAIGWLLLLGDELEQLGSHVAGGATFLNNFILMRESSYFDVEAHSKPLLHLWSLAIEEQFYILWPILLWVSFTARLNLWAIAIAVFFFSVLICLYFSDTNPINTFYNPVTRMWELVAGGILAFFSRDSGERKKACQEDQSSTKNAKLKNERAMNIKIFVEIKAIIGILLIGYSILVLGPKVTHPSFVTFFPVLGTILVILAGSRSLFNRVILTNRPIAWFGLISYPLYLWHWPIISFLYIYFNEPPGEIYLMAGVVASVFLAWCTYRFVEQPIRFGWLKARLGPLSILATLLVIGATGWSLGRLPDVASRGFSELIIQRPSEHAIGNSIKWYHGQDGWLFLGNHYKNTVAKLKLAIVPEVKRLRHVSEQFTNVAQAAHEVGARTLLIVGPNKSSVYPEKLPSTLIPAPSRYVSPFIDELNDVPYLLTIEPTSLLLEKKKSEGILYGRTDTHWNHKGAFLVFESVVDQLGYMAPEINFELSGVKEGDLIEISGLEDFALKPGDHWKFELPNSADLVIEPHPGGPKPSWFWRGVVQNPLGLNDEVVWLVGDSFTNQMRAFMEASFREVHYIGHWNQELEDLSQLIKTANNKPDLVIVVRVERSF